MKIYVASGWSNRKAAYSLMEELMNLGCWVTHNWTKIPEEQSMSEIGCRAIAEVDLRSVQVADVVIVLLPGGNGTHTELGYALACGKPVVIYDSDHFPSPERVMYYHPKIKRVTSKKELMEMVQAWYVKLPR